MNEILAISIWQPWASLIAIGVKRFETRGWSPPYRGPILCLKCNRARREGVPLCAGCLDRRFRYPDSPRPVGPPAPKKRKGVSALEDMVAISLWQPWAHLIAIGAKGYETRGWSTRYRGPMAIHAAKHWTVRMAVQCYQEPFFAILTRAGIRFPARCDRYNPARLGLAFGAVIAVADLVDVKPTEDVVPYLGPGEIAFGDFSHGRHAWQYENVIRLPEPIPCAGRRGLFTLPADVFDEIRTAV